MLASGPEATQKRSVAFHLIGCTLVASAGAMAHTAIQLSTIAYTSANVSCSQENACKRTRMKGNLICAKGMDAGFLRPSGASGIIATFPRVPRLVSLREHIAAPVATIRGPSGAEIVALYLRTRAEGLGLSNLGLSEDTRGERVCAGTGGGGWQLVIAIGK